MPSQPASAPSPPPPSQPPPPNYPPYFLPSHHRTISVASIPRPPAITLEDHTLDPTASTTSALWAHSVSIPSYTVVSPSSSASSAPSSTPTTLLTTAGAYVTYTIRIATLTGTTVTLRKRYSDFDRLRAALLAAFRGSTVPPLPRKSVISRFRGEFLEKRREGLEYFLNCVLLNPDFAVAPVLKEFLFA